MILEAAGLLIAAPRPGHGPTSSPRARHAQHAIPATHSSHTAAQSRLTSKSHFNDRRHVHIVRFLVSRILRVDELEFLGHRWSRAKYAGRVARGNLAPGLPQIPA